MSADDLKAACPDGIDVDFENVGGDILDAVLPLMNFKGRIAICGLISAYNATAPVPGPYNFRSVLVNRLRVHHRGFVDPLDLEQNHGGWVDLLAALGRLAAEIEAAHA